MQQGAVGNKESEMTKNVNTKVSTQYIADMAAIEGFTVEFGKRDGYIVKLENDEFRISIKCNASWYKPKKARIFVDGYAEVDFTAAYDMRSEETGLRRGYNDEMDKLFDKLNRQVVKNQKAVIVEAIDKSSVLRAMLGNAKFGFWKTAGCSCGCSSGFIADAYAVIESDRDGNIHRRFTVEDIFVFKK